MSAMPKTLFSFFAFIILFLSIVSPVSGQAVIQMEKDGGVYKIPCEINGLRLKLIFDTGASNVCISESIAVMMLENGYLEKEDIKGSGSSIVADGRIVGNTHINIKSLKIGELTLNNIEAVVIHQQSAPLLLGQSAIQKLGVVSIVDDTLILDKYLKTPRDDKQYTEEEIAKMIESARYAYDNDYIELATTIYEKLYYAQRLNLEGKLCYATSLRLSNKHADALFVYKAIEQEVRSSDKIMQRWAYFGMMHSFYELGDFDTCIIYGQQALMYADYDYSAYGILIYHITQSYVNAGNAPNAVMLLNNQIDKYLTYKGYKPADCWKKNIEIIHLENFTTGYHQFTVQWAKNHTL